MSYLKMFSDSEHLDVCTLSILEEENRTSDHDRKIRKEGCRLGFTKIFL